MRITRDLLLKLARETAALRARADRHILCIYLSGSLRRDDPLLGGTADIDLFIVHDDEPEMAREVLRLSNEVHLDIAHLSEAVFRQPRRLRIDPWIGGYLCDNPLVLHEIAHWFEFTQAGVNTQFYSPDYVIQRVRPLAESARQAWVELFSDALAPGPQRVWVYLKALENAANAIACLSGVPLPERRFMLHFPVRAQAIQRPGLFAGLVDLYLPEPLKDEAWEQWLSGWQTAFQAAGQIPACPPRLQPCRWRYYHDSASALRTDMPAAAAWIILRTWTAAVGLLPADSPAVQEWAKALRDVGLDEDSFEERVSTLDAYLDGVEETIDQWAAANGV